MTIPPAYRANTIADLLNVLPTLFGFVPEESLIGICLEGERMKFGFRLRIDLPELGQEDSVADIVAGHLDQGAGERVLLVGISERTSAARAAVDSVAARLHSKLIEVAVWTDGSHWWTNEMTEGTKWHQDLAHEAIVKAVTNGQVIRASRSCVEQEFVPSESAITLEALLEAEREFEIRRLRDTIDSIDEGVCKVANAMQGLAAGEPLSDEVVIEAVLWLRELLVRDHFWFEIDHDNAREWLARWVYLANRVEGIWRAAPLSLASFSAWQAGDGVRALIAAESATKAESNYALARLMLRVVEEGLPPTSWTRMRSSIQVDA